MNDPVYVLVVYFVVCTNDSQVIMEVLYAPAQPLVTCHTNVEISPWPRSRERVSACTSISLQAQQMLQFLSSLDVTQFGGRPYLDLAWRKKETCLFNCWNLVFLPYNGLMYLLPHVKTYSEVIIRLLDYN